jgi:hypothetical protein
MLFLETRRRNDEYRKKNENPGLTVEPPMIEDFVLD